MLPKQDAPHYTHVQEVWCIVNGDHYNSCTMNHCYSQLQTKLTPNDETTTTTKNTPVIMVAIDMNSFCSVCSVRVYILTLSYYDTAPTSHKTDQVQFVLNTDWGFNSYAE